MARASSFGQSWIASSRLRSPRSPVESIHDSTASVSSSSRVTVAVYRPAAPNFVREMSPEASGRYTTTSSRNWSCPPPSGAVGGGAPTSTVTMRESLSAIGVIRFIAGAVATSTEKASDPA